jgi:hypothetical protein
MKDVIVTIFLLFSTALSFAQRDSNLRVQFERVVPTEVRRDFCSTIQRGIDTQRRKDWRSLYSIVLPQHRGKSVEGFVEGETERDLTLSDFRIDQINVQVEANVSQKIGMWDVLGCALVQEKGKSVPRESKVTLYLEDGVWYMDMVEILMVVADPPPSPHKCSFKKAIPIAVLCGTK